jgi:hypothetical protein
VNLPPAAQAMYSTWWSFALQAATSRDEGGAYKYDVATFQSAASMIRQDVGGDYLNYNAPGLSQLFSAGRQIGNAQGALAAAAPGDALTSDMVGQAPWQRSDADQLAMPAWQVRAEVTYTDEAGVEQSGTFTVQVSQVLPSTVGSLQAQMALRITDMLATPPGTGTPRSGTLTAVGPLTILQV